ncbi:MAG: Mur ligase family protein, partial [Alphaproteobacteria bacterium]|nr:Mur ligase family protein [Alphaproteobacteria bacterium]
AKAEIFMGMAPASAAILNRDNPQFARLAAAAKECGLKKILGFGRDVKSDARMLECVEHTDSSEIKADILGKKITYRLSVPGLHVAMNSLGALCAAVMAGADLQACAAALSYYKQPKGRGVIQNITLPEGSITVIDESYNASPIAVRFAIRVLGQMAPSKGGRRILALGDMRELGKTSPALHADLAKDIAEAKIDKVFCCGEMMAHLFEALPPALRGAHTKTSAELAPLVASTAHAGDVITIKGSKSMLMPMVLEALRELDEGHASKLAS